MRWNHQYIANENTMIIREAKSIKYGAIVHEVGDVFGTCETPNEIITHTCFRHWVDFTSLRETTKEHTGITRKIPIVICEFNGIVFFQTHALNHIDNHWINPLYIKSIHYEKNRKTSRLLLKNGTEYILPCSYDVTKAQYERALSILHQKRYMTGFYDVMQKSKTK